MKRFELHVLVLLALLAPTLTAFGQGRAVAAADEKPSDKQEEAAIPIPPETSSVTKHDWTSGGVTIHYTATAGNLLIRDDKDKPNASIFYVAYTEDGVEPNTRPVTFLYNGGPGSATMYLHMGSVGPVRVITSSPAETPAAPFQYVTNESSLIDKSDLVFIDAPFTGYSRAVGKGTLKDFAGVDEDVVAFNKFITHYLTLNQRWNSPKFLFGESYGTPRTAALVASLQNDGIQVNGITLLSSVLNYNGHVDGYDQTYISYMPSYAAIAFHYKKGKHAATLAEAVQEAREFARGPYTEALAMGANIPPAQLDSVAQKLADMTGLSVQYVKDANLRISPTRFRAELLRTDDRTVGRLDARFEGWNPDNAGENAGYDPSSTAIDGAYVGALHAYLQKDLKFMNPDKYFPSGPGVNQAWNFKHHPSGAAGGAGGRGGGAEDMPDTALDLADAMRKNPKLKVLSANGYFDLATPFFSTEWDISHMMLAPSLMHNVRFTYYPSGHMVYVNPEALKEFKADLAKFYTDTMAAR